MDSACSDHPPATCTLTRRSEQRPVVLPEALQSPSPQGSPQGPRTQPLEGSDHPAPERGTAAQIPHGHGAGDGGLAGPASASGVFLFSSVEGRKKPEKTQQTLFLFFFLLPCSGLVTDAVSAAQLTPPAPTVSACRVCELPCVKPPVSACVLTPLKSHLPRPAERERGWPHQLNVF